MIQLPPKIKLIFNNHWTIMEIMLKYIKDDNLP